MFKIWRLVTVCSFYLACTIIVYYYLATDNWIFVASLESVKLLLYFTTLGLITSNFLTPSLSYISRNVFQISEKIAGMTLLALGNGLPDIISTYKSMKTGATLLAVGEILGGVFFLLTVVLGLMGLVTTIDLLPQHILKDTISVDSFDDDLESDVAEKSVSYSRNTFVGDMCTFFAVMTLPLLFILKSRLSFIQCIVMATEYCVFMAITLWRNKRQIIEETTNTMRNFNTSLNTSLESLDLEGIMSSSSLHNNTSSVSWNHSLLKGKNKMRNSIRNYFRSKYSGPIKITLQDYLDVWENQGIFDFSSSDDEITAGSSPYDERSPILPKRINPYTGRELPRINISPPSIREGSPAELPNLDNVLSDNINLLSPLDELEDPHFGLIPEAHSPIHAHSLKSVDSKFSYNPTDSQGMLSSISRSTTLTNERATNMTTCEAILDWIKKLKLYHFISHEELLFSHVEVATLLITAPLLLSLSIFIPLVRDLNHSYQFTIGQIIQLSLSPIVISYFSDYGISRITDLLSLLIFTVLISRRLLKVTNHNAAIHAIFGFVMALWAISYCVENVVNILTRWVDKFDVSETILGITVFAWGNSIGDLVSNITFVKIGVLDVAMGACFGSPLLYFVFGLGIDGLIILAEMGGRINNNVIEFEIDFHLKVCIAGIILAMTMITFIIPLNHWKINANVSIPLIICYISVILIQVYYERSNF